MKQLKEYKHEFTPEEIEELDKECRTLTLEILDEGDLKKAAAAGYKETIGTLNNKRVIAAKKARDGFELREEMLERVLVPERDEVEFRLPGSSVTVLHEAMKPQDYQTEADFGGDGNVEDASEPNEIPTQGAKTEESQAEEETPDSLPDEENETDENVGEKDDLGDLPVVGKDIDASHIPKPTKTKFDQDLKPIETSDHSVEGSEGLKRSDEIEDAARKSIGLGSVAGDSIPGYGDPNAEEILV